MNNNKKLDNSKTIHNYWVEKTIVKGKPDREGGERSLGKAIWSSAALRLPRAAPLLLCYTAAEMEASNLLGLRWHNYNRIYNCFCRTYPIL